MVDPITKALLDEVERWARGQEETEGEVPYWLRCPACGKRVVKKELLGKGCYVCAWQGAEDEAALAAIMAGDQSAKTGVERGDGEAAPYRTDCPRCEARAVTRELLEKGCYLCGWRPTAEAVKQEG